MADFLDKAVTAHNLWKSRLREALQGAEPPDERTVGRDDMCDLGKWIHGDGREHLSLKEYENLKTAHAKFHQEVAAVIRMIRAGKKAEATEALDRGAFFKASSAVITAISALKQQRVTV